MALIVYMNVSPKFFFFFSITNKLKTKKAFQSFDIFSIGGVLYVFVMFRFFVEKGCKKKNVGGVL